MKIPTVLLLLLVGVVLGSITGYYAGSHQYVYSTVSGTPERFDPSTGKAWLAVDRSWKILHNAPLHFDGY